MYGFKPDYFEYDSKKLSQVRRFVEEQQPQIMVMTLASFNSEDKILNQPQRENLFSNLPFIQAIAQTNPIVFMDEPQEGMDTPNSVAQIAKLNPLAKIRYSATHKTVRNLLYRLTPYDSYRQGLVKKINVHTVVERNDEATLKLELTDIKEDKTGKKLPEVKLKAWRLMATGKFEFKETNWLKTGDNIGEKTANPSYNNYTIQRIYKSLKDNVYKVEFGNGTEIVQNQTANDVTVLWQLQLEWLIREHFTKTEKLKPLGIKCLSLVFIDRVANYMGENPVIKRIFEQQYAKVHEEMYGNKIVSSEITKAQGYYFATTGKKELTDDENTMQRNREIFKRILEEKEKLLQFDDPIQFIFSHSALGVGWDNPNIFNIATLNQSYSETKKRQEIGRGLRICVNQDGKRIYDRLETPENEEVNLLTVFPNETYESFVAQYQAQIKENYGTTRAGAQLRHTEKGVKQGETKFTKNTSLETAFRRFWQQVACKTEYAVHFDENALIENAIAQLNQIVLPKYEIEVASRKITAITDTQMEHRYIGSERYEGRAIFAPTDLVEEISENTGLAYATTLQILQKLNGIAEIVKNPPRFVQEAIRRIRSVMLDEMVRGTTYRPTGEMYPFSFEDYAKTVKETDMVPTPLRGLFDRMETDSEIERKFAGAADTDDEVVCFMKLPKYYSIPTPLGKYEPDFAVVLKPKRLKTTDEPEFYFVVETKGTEELIDRKALKGSEAEKILYAFAHFKALGIETRFRYEAPVKEYVTFKTRTEAFTKLSL